MEKIVIIKDEKSLTFLPSFIRKFFIKIYYNQGGVYIEKYGIVERPTYVSNTIKWLEKLEIETTSQKHADKLSFEYFKNKYPQYGKYIQLF
jgi:hypothetical protein